MLLIFNLLVTSGIKTQVIINAPAEKVCNILMDQKMYPEWNPFN
ncbi:MAG: hypothetical protein ACJA1Z_003693 [Patiriisocius sp.]|jgi:uncharacterized protein YndB with AHSA1/START domain